MIKFLLVGSAEVPPEELVVLYELEDADYILATEKDPSSYVGKGKRMWLSVRPKGDYLQHKDQRIREYIDFNGLDDTKKAGRKPKFQPKDDWAKKLKKQGRL